MNEPERIYLENRDQWREWLGENHKTKKEIWLIYFKKHTGKARVPYDDAVEEAISFGWIDSIVKRIDDDRYMQKFTPRKMNSNWSELNVRRARKMIETGKMTKAGMEKARGAVEEGKNIIKSPMDEIDPDSAPADLIEALENNKEALNNFRNFSPSCKKRYIGWIISAKKEETRKKRIIEAVQLIEQNVKNIMK